MEVGFCLRLACDFRIIILITHAATEAGQSSSAFLTRGTGAGAPERVLPLNLIYIRLLTQMMEQDWNLFNFQALKLDLCGPLHWPCFIALRAAQPCVYRDPVSSSSSLFQPGLVAGVRSGAGSWEGDGFLHSRVTPCTPFPCFIWTSSRHIYVDLFFRH